MSSIPLISHHLFVAAVNDRTRVARPSGSVGPVPAARQTPVREVPLELVDFGRPRPAEFEWHFETFDWHGSA